MFPLLTFSIHKTLQMRERYFAEVKGFLDLNFSLKGLFFIFFYVKRSYNIQHNFHF